MAEQKIKKQRIECSREMDPQIIRKAILSEVNEPIIFRGYLNGKWNCLEWSPKDWGRVLGEDELTFRIGKRVKDSHLLKAPQWETESLKGIMRYANFLEWANGHKAWTTECNIDVNCNDHWAYFDYFYMKDLKYPDNLQGAIDWGLFGFAEKGLVDSTLWIGSTGANTPCHIDTYGCNLVAQVFGKKRWVLFPKEQTKYLSPTRVPYEESSIYSDVGFPRPDFKIHPRLVSTTPYVVTLEPGDVLFVPNQWWHSVENLEFSLSMNTWLELPSDDDERLKEAMVMYQMGSLCQGIESVDLIASVFNPNMMNVATMSSADLINLLVCKIFQNKKSEEVDRSHSNGNEEYTEKFDWKNKDWSSVHNIGKIEKLSFEKYCVDILGVNFELKDLHPTGNINVFNNADGGLQFCQLKLLIDTFTDPRIIQQMKIILDEKFG